MAGGCASAVTTQRGKCVPLARASCAFRFAVCLFLEICVWVQHRILSASPCGAAGVNTCSCHGAVSTLQYYEEYFDLFTAQAGKVKISRSTWPASCPEGKCKSNGWGTRPANQKRCWLEEQAKAGHSLSGLEARAPNKSGFRIF